MTTGETENQAFNIAIVAQSGRLQFEAVLFAASLRAMSPGFSGRLLLMEPQAGPLWDSDPAVTDPEVRALLTDLGAEFVPFASRHFGQTYPQGNKIEGLLALPTDAPFVFFDTDTLVTGEITQIPFDFHRPTASLRREGTWPQPALYGPGYAAIWKSLYDRFGLDFESSLDPSEPDEFWRRYLYFNAGMFFYHDAKTFAERFLQIALSIRDDPPDELACQSLDPWLDQVALPLVIHGLGGGRDTLPPGLIDGSVTCHYRLMPLLYAREDDHVVEVLEAVTAPNPVKKVLKRYEPFLRMIYQGRGAKARALFDRAALPRREQAIRNRLRREGLWLR
ncbi:hypothetical protein [Pseudooceanicola sp. LIPI14-2-Ac024]|uniref:hypothetical protein n=1 Tax=Pseudooceanicola sp. LIPI14-2-Ac024 TaxID=3344875 RepID=UPI0035CFB58D